MTYLDSLKHFADTIGVQSSLGGKVIRPGSGVTLALPGDVQVREIVRGAGTVLVTQGDRLQEVLIVREGTVLVTCFSSEGDEVWSSVRGPDTLIGAELLRRGRCETDVVALTEVRLLRIAGDDFRNWMGPAHSPALTVIDLLLQEIAATGRDRAMTTGPAVS